RSVRGPETPLAPDECTVSEAGPATPHPDAAPPHRNGAPVHQPDAARWTRTQMGHHRTETVRPCTNQVPHGGRAPRWGTTAPGAGGQVGRVRGAITDSPKAARVSGGAKSVNQA